MKVEILSVCSPSERGGIEATIDPLIKNLESLGATVTFCSVSGAGRRSLYSILIPAVTVLKKLRGAARKDADILVVIDPHVMWLSIFAVFFVNAKTKVTISHGWVFHTRRFLRLKLLYFFLAKKLILPKFDRIWCVSPSDLGRVRDLAKARFLPNPVENLSPVEVERSQRGNRYKFVSLSRLDAHKDIGRSIEIVKELRMQGQDCSLTIMGYGVGSLEYDEQWLTIIDGPPRERIDAEFLSASHFICMSKYEGFGLAVIEAASFGLIPVLNANEAYEWHDSQLEGSILISVLMSARDAASLIVIRSEELMGSEDTYKSLRSYSLKYAKSEIRELMRNEIGIR